MLFQNGLASTEFGGILGLVLKNTEEAASYSVCGCRAWRKNPRSRFCAAGSANRQWRTRSPGSGGLSVCPFGDQQCMKWYRRKLFADGRSPSRQNQKVWERPDLKLVQYSQGTVVSISKFFYSPGVLRCYGPRPRASLFAIL